ncbi:MAG: DegT/DnrJ/EryC1/StrS family aminotransferase [Acidobacteriota bacterium]|jgi:dTDP-4-amino-4,6-dideoxygalactose transaminase|nr:DegT/DnrJ/EryC1/StrS family aminotransferase [Acidobacteriota bacterium]
MNNQSNVSAKRSQIGVGGFNISARAKELVMEVLDSNRITAGPKMAQFESQIAAIHGCQFGLMCNSGTGALQIALAALKERHNWQDGDEVLVPAVTFVATSNVVMYNNLKPVFVDVEPQYYCIDPARIEEKITSRTRAIMPVHLAGQPCDMQPIMEIAERHNLRIVEDSAETMFASDKGKPVGSFGDIGCFSTYAAHMITTGVGGLCTTNDPELIVMLKSLMNHGRDSIYITIDDDKAAKGEALFQIANSRFSFVRLGQSFRCTEMEAALGIAQFEEHEQSCARRLEVVGQLNEGLADLQNFIQLPRPRPESTHSYMFYALTILDERVKRDDLIRFLEDNSIETRYLLPLINQPIYQKIFGNLEDEFPVAARLNQNAFYIGCHPDIRDDEVEYVVEKFHQFFRSYK